MAYENYAGSEPLSFTAVSAVVKHRMVKLDTAGLVEHCTAITDAAIGVALNGAAAGETVAVLSRGIGKVELAGTVTAGVELMVKGSSTGEVDTAAGATARSIGISLEAGDDNEMIAVLLNCPALKAPPNS